MASRRQVREAAVQYLYALATSPENAGGPGFWELVNDRARLTYDRTRVKILAHLQQGRQGAAEKLHQFFIDHAAAILALDPTEKLARDLKALAAAEIKWAEQATHLLPLTKANTGGWRRELDQILLDSEPLRKNRAALVARLEAFPALREKPLLDLFAKLDTYDQRAHMVRFPANHPEQRDFDHLHKLRQEMDKLAGEARDLAEKVIACVDELDPVIDDAATNFELNRLARVDLAILRLATWEILKLPDLDPAISINEAVSLARDFSGEESASFVNGVLDRIARVA